MLVEDLIKYLDPEYIDRIAIPEASKLQFILAGNARLRHAQALRMSLVEGVGTVMASLLPCYTYNLSTTFLASGLALD